MIIMAVDNHYQRLGRLVGCLRTAYPNDEIVDFADPFRAVQYSVSHNVDIVFTDDELQPFNCLEFADLVTYYCQDAIVYVVTAEADCKDSLLPGFDEALNQTVVKKGVRQIAVYANGDVI